MKITDRELANVLERFFMKHLKTIEEGDILQLNIMTKEDKEDYLMELTPTDQDYIEYAQSIIREINEIKGKWII